jgi:methylmalonyl-CoA mutase N-terminal domain/subunit
MRDEFGAKNPKSLMLRFHTQTAGVQLTAQQPEVNLVRVAVQGLGAVLGGTQSLHTNSMDETLALPTEKSVRIALRTQQIAAYETGVANTIDPLAGSYFVEATTNRLEREAEEIFEEIERLGGVVQGLEMGYFQREIALAADQQQREIESGERVIVGVNGFTEGGGDSDIDILRIGDAPETRQHQRLAELRAKRDDALVKQTLDRLRAAGAAGENVIEPMLDCARAYCTMFEIRNALEEVYGAYREPIFF